MFTIASLIEALKQQNADACLRELTAKLKPSGIELSGKKNDGEAFRLVVPFKPKG